MTHDEISQRLLRFIRERNIVARQADIHGDTDLRGGGHVDSMGFVALIALLDELGAKNLDYLMGHADEVRTINQLVARCF